LVWWKESFEKINSELGLIKKKRETLEKLLNSGGISQPTYEYYNKELEEAEKEIENRRKVLIEKINSKMEALEKQLQVLEMLFADLEISYAVGEVDEETYNKQRDVLAIGLDFARKELNSLREFMTSFKAPSTEPMVEKATSEVEGTITETVAAETTEEHVEEAVQEQITSEEIETTTEGSPQEEEIEEVPSVETPVEDLTFQALEKGGLEETEEHMET